MDVLFVSDSEAEGKKAEFKTQMMLRLITARRVIKGRVMKI